MSRRSSRALRALRLLPVSSLSPPAASAASASAAATTAASSILAVGAGGLNANARLEAKLTFRDDHLANLQALADDDFVFHALANRDRALIDRRIIVHHKDELAILSRLYGLARNDDR